MARITKVDLEKKITELEEKLKKYQTWLSESDDKYSKLNDKYNKLLEEKEIQIEDFPSYIQMKFNIEQLELMSKLNKETINRLKNQINIMEEENKKLKEHKHPGGRPKKSKDQEQEQLNQLKNLLNKELKEKALCQTMNISRATLYRLKKLL